jgi:hypothetical protein
MRRDEVPGDEEADPRGAPQSERAVRDKLGHRSLPNEAKGNQTGGHHKGIDDEGMREDARSEWSPFAQKAETDPRGANAPYQ